MRAGFTLTEVLVALVVIEVGILGVVGTVLVAAAVVARAEAAEGVLAGMEAAVDSLQAGGVSGSGQTPTPWGVVGWEAEGRRNFRVYGVVGADTMWVEGIASREGAP